jgi:4-hydroxy-2-oxoglutarate aldolase
MKLTGIIPPVPTPFTAGGELDLPALQALLEVLAPEVDGFLILGSNGEAVFLTEEERARVLAAAREAIPGNKPLLAGTGGEATGLVEERNAAAAAAGADSVLVLPPHYYGSRMTEQALEAHYRRLADRSPVPLLLYNVPANTTLSLSPALIARLARHENICGLKDSSGNIPALTDTMGRIPEGFTVMTGNAPTLLPALALGAAGGILAAANIAARSYGAIISAFRQGDLAAARELQLRLNPLAQAVTTGLGVPGLKAALRLRGRDAGLPRAPLLPATGDDVAALRLVLQQAGL